MNEQLLPLAVWVQVVYGDLVQHIEELSSIRQFTVLERKEEYTPDLHAGRDFRAEGEQ